MMRFTLTALVSLLSLILLQTSRVATAVTTATTTSQQQQSQSAQQQPPADKTSVFRYNNLDYVDTATLEYYLSGPNENFDVAVLYFAQWCKNCHALAPIWDQIAKMLHAGTEHSNLIMALYDCEANMEHMQVCHTAGVKHYPTMQFMSLAGGGGDNNKKPVRLQRQKPRHTTKFGGNWQYGDSIYDWLRAMTALSQWHRRGWGKKLRDLLTGAKKPEPKDLPLPVGIPNAAAVEVSPSSTSAFGSTTGAASSSAADLAKIETLQTEAKTMKEMITRSSTFMEAILFPLSTTSGNHTVSDPGSSRNYTDVFALMHDTNGWSSSSSSDDPTDRILRACLLDVSVDYCSRLATQLTLEMIEQELADDLVSLTEADINRLSEQLVVQVAQREPYCPKAEECVAMMGSSSMATIETTMMMYDSCPFNDRQGCRYLTACLAPEIQQEYATALATMDTAAASAQQQQATTTTTSTTDAAEVPVAQKKGGWFG